MSRSLSYGRVGLIALFGIGLLTIPLEAQTTSFDIIPRGMGARVAGLGHAGVSDVRDVSSMYWNPAGLAMLERPAVVTNVAFLKNRMEAEQAAAVSLALTDDMTLGLAFNTSAHGRDWASPQLVSYGVGIGAGYQVSTTVTFGVLTHLSYASTVRSSLTAASFSWGALYAPTSGLTYGLAYRSLGWGLSYRQRSDGRSPLQITPVSPRVLDLGAAFRFPSQFGPPVITILMSSGRLLGQSRSVSRAGLEFYPWTWIDVRMGVEASGSSVFGHLGAGLRIASYQVDYAFFPGPGGARSHEITATMALPSLGRAVFGGGRR